ncbi:hypothetical protein FE783_12865 [Paenibacillus mesophilus]|uniref:hypothetical protein n=1 Tax=Paenibacillus mesophilus TaxID=2582849 RepID=UPI00110E6E63|nr:hypothetical protein [Paenibacillus mesophilus]TMV49399.1 hypothetical protein FE783_12865 [Paenibacillus mesophilus]
MPFKWRSQDHRKACIAKICALVVCRGMDWQKAAESALHMHDGGPFWYCKHPEEASEGTIDLLIKDGQKWLRKRKGA